MQQITFTIMGQDAESRREIRETLALDGRARVLSECNAPDELLTDLSRLRPDAVAVALRSDHLENGFALIKKILATAPSTAVLTASKEASPAIILGSMRNGAREFLQLPTASEELRTVLDRIGEFCRAEQDASKKIGKVIATFSGKGGAGASFFATNLAVAMNAPTIFLDLNLQAGDAASFLGLDPKYSIVDLVHNLKRLDDSLITSLVTVHSSNLSLVAAPLETHEAEDIKPQDITEILHLVRQKFERVVVDLPHTFDPVTVAALDSADEILLVLTLDIPGIRSTKRALKVFDRLGYPRKKIRVVVNRWSKNIDVELQKVESHLGEQLIGFVPNDYRKVMDSINLGQPLVQTEPASKIAVEIKRIAGLVMENNQTHSMQPKKRLFGSVFGRQNSTTALELKAMPDNV